MRLTYDQEAGALYLRLHDVPVARSVPVSECCTVDLDTLGDVVGIELLHGLPVSPPLLLNTLCPRPAQENSVVPERGE